MNSMAAQSELRALDEVQFKYESNGFHFERHPARERLPAFFEGYIPDAIATKDDKTVVIEVKKVIPDLKVAKRIGAIADRIRKEPGYEFNLVFLPADRAAASTPMMTAAGIEKRLDSARELIRIGDNGGALVVVWSALEAAARRQLANLTQGARGPLTPGSLISALVSFGLVEEEDKPELDAAAKMRNLAAHGETEMAFRKETAEFVISITEKLLK